jgi:hypothetical protein
VREYTGAFKDGCNRAVTTQTVGNASFAGCIINSSKTNYFAGYAATLSPLAGLVGVGSRHLQAQNDALIRSEGKNHDIL